MNSVLVIPRGGIPCIGSFRAFVITTRSPDAQSFRNCAVKSPELPAHGTSRGHEHEATPLPRGALLQRPAHERVELRGLHPLDIRHFQVPKQHQPAAPTRRRTSSSVTSPNGGGSSGSIASAPRPTIMSSRLRVRPWQWMCEPAVGGIASTMGETYRTTYPRTARWQVRFRRVLGSVNAPQPARQFVRDTLRAPIQRPGQLLEELVKQLILGERHDRVVLHAQQRRRGTQRIFRVDQHDAAVAEARSSANSGSIEMDSS